MEAGDTQRQRILLVEDHPPLRAAIQRILEKEGYLVHGAGDGLEALQAMEQAGPDLILADIMMPRMDGYALYDAVRERPEWVPIPFIFLTARAEREDVLRGKEIGAEDYLTKPLDPRDLVAAVRGRLRRARAIRQSTEAELSDLKHQIITVVGYELRTPLTYVTGYTELALEDAPSLSPQEFEQYLRGISKGAGRLNRLVEDCLLLIQLDSGQAEDGFRTMVRTSRDLRPIVESALRRYEEQASARDVVLEAELAADLPPVRLCELFFVDALARLVENGIKFSRDGQRRVTVSARASGGNVEVAVADEGVGIAAQNIPLLFQPFRQIDRGKMEQQGTGLGLAIAQELIHLHGGEITVESTPGEGSTFTIRLPAAAGR